jgi:hypothetical protein
MSTYRCEKETSAHRRELDPDHHTPHRYLQLVSHVSSSNSGSFTQHTFEEIFFMAHWLVTSNAITLFLLDLAERVVEGFTTGPRGLTNQQVHAARIRPLNAVNREASVSVVARFALCAASPPVGRLHRSAEDQILRLIRVIPEWHAPEGRLGGCAVAAVASGGFGRGSGEISAVFSQ